MRYWAVKLKDCHYDGRIWAGGTDKGLEKRVYHKKERTRFETRESALKEAAVWPNNYNARLVEVTTKSKPVATNREVWEGKVRTFGTEYLIQDNCFDQFNSSVFLFRKWLESCFGKHVRVTLEVLAQQEKQGVGIL